MVLYMARASVVLFRTDESCPDRVPWEIGNCWIGHVPRVGKNGLRRGHDVDGLTSINFRDRDDFGRKCQGPRLGWRRMMGTYLIRQNGRCRFLWDCFEGNGQTISAGGEKGSRNGRMGQHGKRTRHLYGS